MAPHVGGVTPGPKEEVVGVAIARARGLTGMANFLAPGTSVYRKKERSVEAESDIEEDSTSSDIVACTKTENGTPVCLTTTPCNWKFEDSNGRVQVGISCILPSSVGMTNAQLDSKLNDVGTVLHVYMYQPKAWSTGMMKKVDKFCLLEKCWLYAALLGRAEEGVREADEIQQK
jgi:hypothetical protein